MFWSVHKYDKCLDRCGKASAFNFDILSHAELTELVRFCLQDDSFCQGAGSCWSRSFALPMGGPFSAQAADLHSLWGFHVHKQRFYALGKLRTTDSGYPIWVNNRGRIIALAQFRDNVIVASKGLGASWAMLDVCKLLQHAWSLRVLCPCISEHVHDCQLTCMNGDLYTLGIATERRCGWGTVYVHPSAVNTSWQLKQGAPLQSPWAVTETSLSNLFTGVLMNCRPFLSGWSEYLMSVAAWLQISILCGHDRNTAVRACQKAMQRFLSYSPHDVTISQRWVVYVSRCMPCTKEVARGRLWEWLKQHAIWDGQRYASWHIPHDGALLGAEIGQPVVSPGCLHDTQHNAPPQKGGGGRGSVAFAQREQLLRGRATVYTVTAHRDNLSRERGSVACLFPVDYSECPSGLGGCCRGVTGATRDNVCACFAGCCIKRRPMFECSGGGDCTYLIRSWHA